MMEFFVFIIRLDLDQAARYIAKNEVTLAASTESVFETGLSRKAVNRDYYEFEGTSERIFLDVMTTVTNPTRLI